MVTSHIGVVEENPGSAFGIWSPDVAGRHAGGDERLPVQDVYEPPDGHGLTSTRGERI